MTTRCLQCNARYRSAKSSNGPSRRCIRCQPHRGGRRSNIEAIWLYLSEHGPAMTFDIALETGVLEKRAIRIVSRHPWFQAVGVTTRAGLNKSEYEVRLYGVVA
ncbi:hypothetical protein LCGC14_0610100 [marine sediment metagenome]|uniref:Uncharacterized protein n=1 Tax=marine sediment metagenome TaxID=412755 RepID=A0A0F9RS44_9ZZZZ